MIASIFLISPGAYLVCGIAFAIPFVLKGARRIDPHAAHGSWGFRVLIIPGARVAKARGDCDGIADCAGVS